MKRTILSLALLLNIPTSVFAQQPDCRHRTIPVGLVDEKRVPIAGFTAEEFRGEFRGEPVRIVSASLDINPRRIVILLDLSGSMLEGKKNRVAQILVWHILRSFPNGSELALITFKDKVIVQAGLTRDRHSISELALEVSSWDRMAFKGSTHIWDAVEEAIKLLNPPQPGDVVYVVTDGQDYGSRIRLPDIEKALLGAGMRIFASLIFAESYFRGRTPEESSGVTPLSELAERTGGGVLRLRAADLPGIGREFDFSEEGQKQIFKAANPLLLQMRQFYLVEIELMKEVDKPRSWKLKLASNSGPLKNYGLYYPQKLLPCSEATIKKAAQP